MNRLPSTLLPKSALLLACAIALPAAAQFAKPADAIKYRKAAFSLMSAHFGRVAAMADGRVPFDARLVAANAELATRLARLPFSAFVPGSEQGDTRAEAEVWTEPDNFRRLATEMQTAMDGLNAAAQGNRLDAIKAAVEETGKRCQSCHDNYRKE